jgi:hypothetical protein
MDTRIGAGRAGRGRDRPAPGILPYVRRPPAYVWSMGSSAGGVAVRRRRLVWLLAGLVLVNAAEYVSIARPPGLTPKTYKQLPGLSRAEVERLLGPPGDYRSGPTSYDMGGPPEELRWPGTDLR